METARADYLLGTLAEKGRTEVGDGVVALGWGPSRAELNIRQ